MHGRFNTAALDANVAERTIVQFAQGLDGLAARKMGDDAVHPATEQAEKSGRCFAGRRLTCRLGYRRHRSSPSFARQTAAADANAGCAYALLVRLGCTPLSAISGLMGSK